MKRLLFYTPTLLVLMTCVKSYDPDITKYECVVVIDGTLTDDGTPPLVSISYSSKVGVAQSDPISGVVVYILTSDGQKYDLPEKGKGSYTYTQSMFPVTTGASYQLVVEHEGNVYKSTMETLLASSPITDISFEAQSDREGVDLLISTEESDSASRYYLWKLTETWKFRSPVYSEDRSVNKDVCYATTTDELELGTTELFSRNSFDRYPFLYIPVSSPKLFYRYSILVEQLSISRDTYTYLNYVKTTNESGGSLFDPVPANINGNITSESAPVIGNFQVSSVKSKRIYIDRSDLPSDLDISAGMEDCRLEQVLLSNSQAVDSLSRIMIVMDTSGSGSLVKVQFVTAEYCFDCTATGYPNTPPSWWVEE